VVDGVPTETMFEYVAWIRANYLPPDDEDYECPMAFLIVAATPDDAKAWGDHLANRRFGKGGDEEFLRSTAEKTAYTSDDLLVVRVGEEASDDHIGWGSIRENEA
jgi:hypothetical protein